MRRAVVTIAAGLGVLFFQVLLVSGLHTLMASADSVTGCSFEAAAVGFCEPDDGGGVTIGGTETEGDLGSGDKDGDAGAGNPGHPGSDTPSPSPQQACAATPGPPSAYCRSLRPAGMVDAVPMRGAPGWSVTITDLARFIPSATAVAGEPGNVAVVGLPANFLSSAKTETLPGTVLGRPLTIRFTPVNYAFDYGDGHRRDTTGPGTAWDANGQTQFTPTNTSHVYEEAGRYTVSVAVTYSADIDLGSGWIPIRGTLNGPPASQEIRVVKAHTALVLGTCHERPSAPGC